MCAYPVAATRRDLTPVRSFLSRSMLVPFLVVTPACAAGAGGGSVYGTQAPSIRRKPPRMLPAPVPTGSIEPLEELEEPDDEDTAVAAGTLAGDDDEGPVVLHDHVVTAEVDSDTLWVTFTPVRGGAEIDHPIDLPRTVDQCERAWAEVQTIPRPDGATRSNAGSAARSHPLMAQVLCDNSDVRSSITVLTLVGSSVDEFDVAALELGQALQRQGCFEFDVAAFRIAGDGDAVEVRRETEAGAVDELGATCTTSEFESEVIGVVDLGVDDPVSLRGD